MSPIKGLTDVRRLPRLGKIRLGVKKISVTTRKEYPAATPYFVCPIEVQTVYGEKPTRLDIIIPVEDDELWASQYYRQYSRTRGLVCKGDGVTCRRMTDTETGGIAGKTTEAATWQEGAPCAGRECPDYQSKACQEVMNLQVLLPRVPGLGVWQIDTGSINSIRNINDCATMIRAVCGRVSWIPLVLTLEPTEVVNPDDGKKKTVHCMHLRQEKGLLEIIEASNRPKTALFITAPLDTEPPEDRELNRATPENVQEIDGRIEDCISYLWPQPVKPLTPSQKPPPVQSGEARDGIEASTGTPPSPEPEKGNQSGIGEEVDDLFRTEAKPKVIKDPKALADPVDMKQFGSWLNKLGLDYNTVYKAIGVPYQEAVKTPQNIATTARDIKMKFPELFTKK